MFELDHIGIAVEDLEASLATWKAIGASVGGIETVDEQKVRVAFLETGSTKTELLEATDPESPIARFLSSGRRGVHHVCFRVSDLNSTLTRLKSEGVPLINESPVSGSRGTRIAFVHPRGTGGILMELVEYPENSSVTDSKEA